MKTDKHMFDWGLYGAMVRHTRNKLGFTKAEDFGAALWRRTRIYISRDVLYKIEQGRQVPDAMQFMALNLVLFGSYYPELKVIDMCLSSDWEYIEKHNELPNREFNIPENWKEENSKMVAESKNKDKLSSGEASRIAEDESNLFVFDWTPDIPF